MGVGGHSLLQGIFPTQGLNLGLPALQSGSLRFEPPGTPIPPPPTPRAESLKSSVYFMLITSQLE